MNAQLKVVLVVITVVWLGLAMALRVLSLGVESKSIRGMLRIPVISQLAYLVWLMILYGTIFQLDGFEAEVRQRAAKVAQLHEKTSCTDSRHDSWNEQTLSTFVCALALLLLSFSVYSCLLSDVNQSIILQFENRTQASLKHIESSLGIETKKKQRRVSFQLPEKQLLSASRLSRKLGQLGHAVLRYKRQATLASICLVFSTVLLPENSKHAFTYSVISIKDSSITSDNVFAGMALFTGLELVRLASQSIELPDGEGSMRMAIVRFIAFYGIILLVLSSVVFLQADDTLKIYIYKIFTPCGSSKLGDSFFGMHIPNENIVSTILCNNMIKYTESILRRDFSEEEKAKALKDAIGLFSQVLGDCVTVLLFASLVVIPGVLAFVSS